MDPRWLQWIMLNALTGSPLVSVALLVGLGWAADSFTFGLLPSPARAWRRYRRAQVLERTVAINLHDRRARYELADLWLDRGRAEAALALLKPSIAAGEDDAATLLLMGRACFAAGHPEQAEVFLDEARARDAQVGHGALDLETGRGRLLAKRPREALAPLQAYVALHPGAVEARALLGDALAASGDAAGARAMRAQAWAAYASAPLFLQRRERRWAWRARPSRPILYAVLAVTGAAVLYQAAAPELAALRRQQQQRRRALPAMAPAGAAPDNVIEGE
jgi:hypothetical protein